MGTHGQPAPTRRPSRLATAVRWWTLLGLMLLIGVVLFLVGWATAEMRYGTTGACGGLAVGAVVAVGAALGLRRSVHAPPRRGIVGWGALVGCGGLVGLYLLRALDMTIALDPGGAFLIGAFGYAGVHMARERMRYGPAVWDGIAARRRAFREARRDA